MIHANEHFFRIILLTLQQTTLLTKWWKNQKLSNTENARSKNANAASMTTSITDAAKKKQYAARKRKPFQPKRHIQYPHFYPESPRNH